MAHKKETERRILPLILDIRYSKELHLYIFVIFFFCFVDGLCEGLRKGKKDRICKMFSVRDKDRTVDV